MKIVVVEDLMPVRPDSEWLPAEFVALDGRVHWVQFTPDGSLLAVCGAASVFEFWSTFDWTRAVTLDARKPTNTLAFDTDGTELLAPVEQGGLLFIPVTPDALIEKATDRVARAFSEWIAPNTASIPAQLPWK